MYLVNTVLVKKIPACSFRPRIMLLELQLYFLKLLMKCFAFYPKVASLESGQQSGVESFWSSVDLGCGVGIADKRSRFSFAIATFGSRNVWSISRDDVSTNPRSVTMATGTFTSSSSGNVAESGCKKVGFTSAGLATASCGFLSYSAALLEWIDGT